MQYNNPLPHTIPFVGRHTELRRLLEHCQSLERADPHRSHLVLIEGVSGAGKTMFAEQCLASLSRTQKALTSRGAYSPHIRRGTLAPFTDMLDELMSERFVGRRLLPLFADQAYAPLLSRLPQLCSTYGLDPGTAQNDGQNPETISALISSALLQVARLRPVVMLLDDVQWMPEQDRRTLAAINAGLRDAPVLILATLRSEAGEAGGLREILAPLTLDNFRLQPLSQPEIGELITKLCGAQVGTRIATDLERASEGLPFRAVELLRSLGEENLLTLSETGIWRLDQRYDPSALSGESVADDRLRRLMPEDQRIVLLLDCAGALAGRGELSAWSAAMDGRTRAGENGIGLAIERLQQAAIVRTSRSDPDSVVFAHDGIGEAQRRLRSNQDVQQVAGMIVNFPPARQNILGWAHDPELFRTILGLLPDPGTPEREEIMSQLTGTGTVQREDPNQHLWNTVNMLLLGMRESLTLPEQARLLIGIVARKSLNGWIPVEDAGELHRLTSSAPSCARYHSLGCAYLAAAKAYSESSDAVIPLIEEAERALPEAGDIREQTLAGMLIEELRALTAGDPRRALEHTRRAYQLSDRLGHNEKKYEMFSYMLLFSARARDHEQFRLYCTELLNMMGSRGAGPAALSFFTVFTAIRSALTAGDMFLARRIFETWSSNSTILSIHDYVGQCYLACLFALNEGEPAIAAANGLNGLEEFGRLVSSPRPSISMWRNLADYAPVQIWTVQSLIASGQYLPARDFAEQIMDSAAEQTGAEGIAAHAISAFATFSRWLKWRLCFSDDEQVSLWWDIPGETSRPPSAPSNKAVEAAQEFRSHRESMLNGPMTQVRFITEMMYATIECAHGNFTGALEAVNCAAEAGSTFYSWIQDLECRASAITIGLRQARRQESPVAEQLVSGTLDLARTLFSMMAERGLTRRIVQLQNLFMRESAGQGDADKQFERLGAIAQASAHTVVQNSRSDMTGPAERTRLFLMGPLRLMRPYSYMELSESAFERETARTLLTALAAAAITGTLLTREELAGRIAPNAKSPEQQKKALYNAINCARKACGSAESILPSGANGLELNTSPELEGMVWTDALEALKAIHRAREFEGSGMMNTAFDEYRRALSLTRKGEFATDCYADWVDAAREQMRREIRSAAIALGGMALRNGLHAAGIEWVGMQLTRDPHDEECHRLMMRLHNEAGNRSAALRQYEKCSRLIRSEFGVDPEPETQALFQAIKRADLRDTPV